MAPYRTKEIPFQERRTSCLQEVRDAPKRHLGSPLGKVRATADAYIAVSRLLGHAGIQISGKRAWDIEVNDDRFFSRALAGGSLALGESYMDGWWECRALDQFFHRFFSADLEDIVTSISVLPAVMKSKLLNMQSRRRAQRVGHRHYDIGTRLYQRMLDPLMTYSCGYWREASDLEGAQRAKLDLVCRKIGLKPAMTVLDIGCGWGSFARYAAENYGARTVGVTISKEQASLARELCRGLPVEIRLQDYRDVEGIFDHVISLGMFEHVGYKNYRTYMEKVRRCLRPGGLFLVQTFGRGESQTMCDPWFDRYIFPGGMIPSVAQVGEAAGGLFVMEDWHNFGSDYDRTLMAWHDNFSRHWSEIRDEGGYDERFRRMWRYYLLCLAGAFRARKIQLWQIVFSPNGVQGTYRCIR